MEKTNVNGGALALGHPLGNSGSRAIALGSTAACLPLTWWLGRRVLGPWPARWGVILLGGWPDLWLAAVERAMAEDHSWDQVAGEYLRHYQQFCLV